MGRGMFLETRSLIEASFSLFLFIYLFIFPTRMPSCHGGSMSIPYFIHFHHADVISID